VNLLLFRSGWVFIGLTLVLIFFPVLPPRPFNPDWQLNFISALLANSAILLLGAVLVCYASRREELDGKSLRQVRLMRTVLAWASLGLLLLVPVQFVASTGIVRTNYFNGMASMRQLGKVIENLRETKNEQEFREQLSKFPNLPALPAKFDQPYQDVRDTIIQSLSSRKAASINQFAKTRDENFQVVIKESFRNSASLILFSYGFMAIALADSSQRNVITSLAMLLEKLRVGGLWFASPKRRKTTPINPAWIDEEEPKS
jgi:hypothetical protein